MKEFGVMQDTFPGSEDVYKNRWEASIANLDDAQRDKLLDILYPKSVQPVSIDKTTSAVEGQDISIDGDIVEIWDKIPEQQRLDMQYGIQYVLSQWYKWDLILARWAKDHTWDWEETVWPLTSLDEYNLIAKSTDKHIPWSSNILLVLRVSPTWTHAAKLSAELVEIPADGTWGGRKAMLMSGMAFHKLLNGEEFIEKLTTHKNNPSIAA